MAGLLARSALAAAAMLGLLQLSSCGITYYYPTPQNVGVLKEQGDIHASVTIDPLSRAAAAGYAFTDHWGVLGNFRLFYQNEGSKPSFDAYMWEPELVYTRGWKRYPEQEDNLFWSLHLAYGHGELARDQDHFNLNFNRLSLQPGFGFNGKYIDVAISSRFTIVNHNFTQLRELDPSINMSVRDYYGLYDVGQQPFGFFEPALTFGAGTKYVKLRVQMVLVGQIGEGYIGYLNLGTYLSANFTLNSKELRGE